MQLTLIGVIMSNAMVMESAVCRASSAGASCQPMPLTFLRRGDAAQVVRVRGKGDVHHHLENLGFVEGAKVSVVSEQAGSFIVEIKRRSRRRAIAMTDAAGRLRCRADPINRNRREDRKEEHG